MILSDFIIVISWLLLMVNDLRLLFLLIHHGLFVVDRLIVLHLIVILPCTLVLLDLFFCLFSVDVVLVFWVPYAFVLLAPILLTILFIVIVLMCVAVVVLFRVLLIIYLLDIFLALFHLRVRLFCAHTCRLLVMVHFVVHLTEVLLLS